MEANKDKDIYGIIRKETIEMMDIHCPAVGQK